MFGVTSSTQTIRRRENPSDLLGSPFCSFPTELLQKLLTLFAIPYPLAFVSSSFYSAACTCDPSILKTFSNNLQSCLSPNPSILEVFTQASARLREELGILALNPSRVLYKEPVVYASSLTRLHQTDDFSIYYEADQLIEAIHLWHLCFPTFDAPGSVEEILSGSNKLRLELPVSIREPVHDPEPNMLFRPCQSLTRLPEEIALCTELTNLQLYNNKLSFCSSSVTQLTSLKILNLSQNLFSQFPCHLENLSSLDTLYLANNQLCSLPESISKMQNLKELYLSFNFFTAFPESVCGLNALKVLNLSCNKLTTVPECIDKLQNLRTLILSQCALSSIQESIGNLPNLLVLDISHNQLASLPEKICRLSKLECLDISHNQFPNPLPSVIGELSPETTVCIDDSQVLPTLHPTYAVRFGMILEERGY